MCSFVLDFFLAVVCPLNLKQATPPSLPRWYSGFCTTVIKISSAEVRSAKAWNHRGKLSSVRHGICAGKMYMYSIARWLTSCHGSVLIPDGVGEESKHGRLAGTSRTRHRSQKDPGGKPRSFRSFRVHSLICTACQYPLRESNPCPRTENPISWASRRRGRAGRGCIGAPPGPSSSRKRRRRMARECE